MERDPVAGREEPSTLQPRSHIQEFSSAYIAFPSFLLVVALGLMTCGAISVANQLSEICQTALAQGLLTLAFQMYHLVADIHPRPYNYYAIVILDLILLIWYTCSLFILVGKLDYGHIKDVEIALIALYGSGWMILLITVVLFVTTVANYRNGGGREDVENGAGTIEDINMDNVGRNTNTSNGNMAVMDGNTDTSESFNNFQNRASVYYDLGQSYSPPRYGSVNTSNNRTSVYYDLGQSYSPPQPDPVNTSNNRTSVHYVSGDTDHPLRMNPADSIGSVRSIPPNVETPEQAGMHAVLGCIVPGCSCRWCTERRNAAHERATANSSSNSCAGIVEWLRCICLQ